MLTPNQWLHSRWRDDGDMELFRIQLVNHRHGLFIPKRVRDRRKKQMDEHSCTLSASSLQSTPSRIDNAQPSFSSLFPEKNIRKITTRNQKPKIARPPSFVIKTYTPPAPEDDKPLSRVVLMDLLGLENTSFASMGHDQVLGTTDNMARAFLVQDVAMGLKERVVCDPA